MANLFAGLDVSTQSTKLVVIDLEREDVIHVDLIAYDKDLPDFGTVDGIVRGLEDGVAESEPSMWLTAVNKIFERLQSSSVFPGDICSLSVSGQQHGLVALDEAGHLTRGRSKLWNDYSTHEECALLTESLGGPASMIEAVGNVQRPGYTASKIFHMVRHEPEAFEKTKTFFLVHNYVNWYLTGGTRVMEPGDTSGMALWHPKSQSYSATVLDAIHPELKKKLPAVRRSDASIGLIAPTLSERFGFSPECTIDAGSGDNMYGAIGTGNVEPGIVTVSLGTSGTGYAYSEEPFIDSEGEIAAFCDATGHHLPLVCVSNLANGYNDLLRLFDLSHEEFNAVVERTRPGNEGRVLLPWYSGERTPDIPLAAPIYFGFPLHGLDRESLCRAVLEGHVMNLYAGFDRMPVVAEEIRLTGGLSRSTTWCQTIADIFEAEVVPVEGEGAALGAAIHAAWVWLRENGDSTRLKELVSRFVKIRTTGRCKPRSEHREVYRHQKELFRALSRRARGLPAEDPFRLRDKLVDNLRRSSENS